MSTLTDDDLTRLLGAAASSFAVPDDAPVRDQLTATAPDRVPLRERLRPLLVGAAVLAGFGVLATGAVVSSGGGSGDADQAASSPASGESQGFQGVVGEGGASTGGSVSSDGTAAVPESLGSKSRADGSVPGDSGGAVGGGAGGAASTSGSTRSAPQATGSDTSAGGSSSSAPAPDQGRVVKTGAISLLVDNGKVSSTLTGIQQVATAQGAIVFASSTSEAGDTPTGQITLRVPVNRFEATVVAIRGLDAEVASATTRASDVTAQFSDLQTQIRTLEAARERYLVILGRTDTVGEILSVQQRVDAVTSQVDQLKGRLRVLGAQSDLSTLTVGVTEKGDPAAAPVTRTERTGISAAWHDAVDGFTSGVNGIVSRSGRTLVVLLFLGVLGLVALGGYRVVRRRLL